MSLFGSFYLDKEKDIIVNMYKEAEDLSYVLETPNHKTGNLITNLAKICELPLSENDKGLKIIKGKIPCYRDIDNKKVYILRLGNTKVANIYPDGTIDRKASIPAISKTLMSQTKNYRGTEWLALVKTYILNECKFKTDLHTHMNACLDPDILISLGIHHQIRYPLYYIKKLGLKLTEDQKNNIDIRRRSVAKQFKDSLLKGKYLTRKIDDHTYINFADLILNNIENVKYNLPKIRASLTILKDGQAVFTNLEKVYLYRYVFTKGQPYESLMKLKNIDKIGDPDIIHALKMMEEDRLDPRYKNNSIFQDKLLWIGRSYKKRGISYTEISDTTLVKKEASIKMLKEVHEVMPYIYEETGVMIRFLAAIRRIPLTIVKDQIDYGNYFKENIEVLKGVAKDPYVAGSDILGEEINDIKDLKPVLKELVKITLDDPSFVIRIHAGENDSLRDNVYNSILCVKESLAKGQNMPDMRIGHGLYTANLNTAKGRQLIEALLKYHVTLEFQITSNVRLNNLSELTRHPLRQYLSHGVYCVQGTDGGALYGTDSIDEELSLERLLHLTREDLLCMREAEDRIIHKGIKAFKSKSDALMGKNLEEALQPIPLDNDLILHPAQQVRQCQAPLELNDQILPLPEDKIPIVIVGGSFNNDRHVTRVKEKQTILIDEMLRRMDPDKVFFVIGHTLTGYEKYLLDHNHGRFDIYAFVPILLDSHEVKRLRDSGVKIRVSIEPYRLGVYKSFAYEIFKRRFSLLVAFDGNSAGVNMIQEAKNSRYKTRVFVNGHCQMLRRKAVSISGYITFFDEKASIIDEMKLQINKHLKTDR